MQEPSARGAGFRQVSQGGADQRCGCPQASKIIKYWSIFLALVTGTPGYSSSRTLACSVGIVVLFLPHIRFVTKGTVEAGVLLLQERKLKLADDVLSGYVCVCVCVCVRV